MTYLTYRLVLLAISLCGALVKANDPILEGEDCTTDISCLSSCCNNDGNYSITGKCVDIEEDERCKSRRFLSQSILIAYLGLFFILIVVCSLMKRKPVNDYAAYVRNKKCEGLGSEVVFGNVLGSQ